MKKETVLTNYLRPVEFALAMTLLLCATGRAPSLWARIHQRLQRTASRAFFGRFVSPCNPVPLISFTFDDFPQSALLRGGAILKSFGARGSYYASLGFMGRDMGEDRGDHMPVGQMFCRTDLEELLAEGHELGCHTFGHCHSWLTSPDTFERSVIDNMLALDRLFDGTSFRTLSYPVSGPRPQTKRRMAKHFMCCRGSGQGFNAGRTDLNYLNAYFLREGKSHFEAIKQLIDENCQQRGWLIFATHDVSDKPSPFGCNPRLFEAVVRYAMKSKALVLPVAEACELFITGRDQKNDTAAGQFASVREGARRNRSRFACNPLS